jgi:hypothetical protein
MTRTQRTGKIDPGTARERIHGHDFEDQQVLAPAARFANGTPWPAPTQVPSAEIDDPFLDDADEQDVDLTEPVPVLELDAASQPVPLQSPMVLEIDDVGTRTLMGVGARAVRAIATSGCVEARPARGRQTSPEGPTPSAPLPGVDSSARSAPGRVVAPPPGIAPVQPVPDLLDVPSLASAQALTMLPAQAAPPRPAYVEPPKEAVSTTYVRGWAYAMSKPPEQPGSRLRVIVAVAVAVAVFALAAYLTATMV